MAAAVCAPPLAPLVLVFLSGLILLALGPLPVLFDKDVLDNVSFVLVIEHTQVNGSWRRTIRRFPSAFGIVLTQTL